MKKLLIAFVVILGMGALMLGAGAFFLYRAAAPVLEDARNYMRGLSELSKLDAEIKNHTPHIPPDSGELNDTQVERFTRVQEHVRTALGQRMREFEAKYQHLNGNGSDVQPSIRELVSGLGELAEVFVQARRYQVDALNKESFSQDEYSWVRNRVFEAAGMHAVGQVDLRRLEEAVREGTGFEVKAPPLPKVDIPAKNLALVKPHMKRVDEWIPLAFFGL